MGLVLALNTFNAYSASTDDNALPDNEDICEQQLTRLLNQKQMVFSDRNASPTVRRDAERAIDGSRKIFGQGGSYCEAKNALEGYRPDKNQDISFRDGEVNYYGRG